MFSLVLPGLAEALASAHDWWRDNAGWFDLNQARFLLFDSELSNRNGSCWLSPAGCGFFSRSRSGCGSASCSSAAAQYSSR
jgi:hypothetical protein